MRRLLLSILVFATVAASPTPGLAASVEDSNQARGPLDLRRLAGSKHDATAPLHVRLTTYGRWPAKLLDADGPNRLFLLFQANHDGNAEFIGEIRFLNGRLSMRVTRRSGTFVRRLPVRHPTRDEVRMTLPRGLPNPDGQIKLAATMRYRTSQGPCSNVCDERIPNGGWLKVTPGL